MRFGVSAKIFAAYAALLGAFAATGVFTFLYLQHARQRVAAIQVLSQVEVEVDTARGKVFLANEMANSLKSRPLDWRDPRPALSLAEAHDRLAQAVTDLDSYLASDSGDFRKPQFQQFRAKVAPLNDIDQLKDGVSRYVMGTEKPQDTPFASTEARVESGLAQKKKQLDQERITIARELEEGQDLAVRGAAALGLIGLLTAIGAALFMLRTLRPLGVLREHAREIAGGDYARRTGVRSRDEIGDLAREFDAMAHAIEEREQKLIRSERLATVGRMAAHITHEVRNPLASIGLYVDLLGDELGPGDEEGRRLLRSMANEIDRLSEITETYLRFVRLPTPDLMAEDLGAIVSSAAEFSRAELALAGVALTVDVDPAAEEVAADENQIRQAVLNLIRNAKEAMPAGGKLTLSVVRGRAGRVVLSVTDSGPGIPPEHLAKIFDPFFSTKTKGTGLGLALVQQIVSEHGGRIEVQTPAQGGTCFVIGFPVAHVGPSARTPDGVSEPADEPGLPDDGAPTSAPA